jgi:flagellar motor protein MotB
LKQEDFYASHHDSSGWSLSRPLTDLNTPMNEGAQSISADGRLLFFTLCNHPDGFGSCDIYFSRFESGRWTKPRNAGSSLNTAGWEGQPSLSAFGDQLFFSSDRPGGRGKKDIWIAKLKEWKPDGTPVWGEITNPGDSINTQGDEISPFIHPNGRDLYFCSDYWPGFGGYDIFHSYNKGGEGWSEAKNLGYPVNSPGNEQGMIIDRSGSTAYFSSNRGTAGNMDIFSFEVDDKLRPEAVTYMRGKVISKKTGLPVSAEVHLSGTGQETLLNIRVQSGEDGVFTLVLPENVTLSFSISKEGFLFYSERFHFSGPSSAIEPLERRIELTPVEPGSSLNLYNIFFETNAYTILPESEPELEILTDFLRKNPSLSVEIQGHTDNVGSAEYNLQLSEKRAGSVKQYLLNKGIFPVRLSSKGYGMEQPVAPNDTDEGRSKNRRTTMKIIE